MRVNRLEAFSDGVIAIIITIMVLDLHVPTVWTELEVWKMVPILLSYALSYLIVAIYWVNHHHLIHLVQRVDAVTLWANMNLLFWMSFMPWVSACLGKEPYNPAVVDLYDGIALACSLSFHRLRRSIARQHRGEPHLTALHRQLARKNFLAVFIYVAALPVAWVSVQLAMVLIILPAIMYFFPDFTVERLGMEEGGAAKKHSLHKE